MSTILPRSAGAYRIGVRQNATASPGASPAMSTVPTVPTVLGAVTILLLASLAPALAVESASEIGAGATETATAKDPDPTFSDIAPILQRSCQRCHRPGTSAPMSLLTYEETRPWARSIQRRVVDREMPPWHIDRTIGQYDPDPSLSDQEVQLFSSWVEAGAPRGNPEDLPPPIEWPSSEDWEFGPPDLVVEMEEEMVVPATGPDLFQSFVADSGLEEDRYIRWIEVKPSVTGRESLHHVIVYAIQDDTEYVGGDRVERDDDPTRVDSEGNPLGSLLIEYAVGNTGDVYSEDTGKLLMAGAKIRFSGHYHSLGEQIRDRTRVGFGFYPKGVVPKHRIISTRIFAGVPGAGGRLNELNIPPHASDVRHDGYRVLPRPAKIISFQAHMHYRGKAMELEAIHLDGRREPLTRITDYDFNWQIAYPYKNPPVFPAGTVLHVTSWHDNSANNPHNPDPTAWVGWGNRTVDDMAIGWTNFVYLTDDDYRAHLEDDRASASESP